jgi:hypothetical protein
MRGIWGSAGGLGLNVGPERLNGGVRRGGVPLVQFLARGEMREGDASAVEGLRGSKVEGLRG